MNCMEIMKMTPLEAKVFSRKTPTGMFQWFVSTGWYENSPQKV